MLSMVSLPVSFTMLSLSEGVVGLSNRDVGMIFHLSSSTITHKSCGKLEHAAVAKYREETNFTTVTQLAAVYCSASAGEGVHSQK